MMRERILSSAGVAALFCVAWIVVLPVGNNRVLLPVLAALGTSCALLIVVGRRRLARELVPLALLTVIIASLGVLAGATNPGLYNGLYVAVAIPAFYWFCIAAVRLENVRPLLNVIAVATVISGAGIVIYVFGELGLLPRVLPEPLLSFVGAGFAQDSGGTAIRFFGLSTFVATAPMWITACVVPRSVYLPSQWLCRVAALLSLGAVLLGGRRAIVVVALIVPAAVVVLRIWNRARTEGWRVTPVRIGVALAGGAATVAAALVVAPMREAVLGVVAMVTGQGRGEAEVLRAEQGEALLADWLRSPFFGHGWGAGIDGYQRFVDRPWVYELQYHYLLAQVGVVGVLLSLLLVILGLRVVVAAARALPEIAPALYVSSAAGAAMIIANASNPYLRVPGHMWAVFLPLAIAGAVLISTRKSPAVALSDEDKQAGE